MHYLHDSYQTFVAIIAIFWHDQLLFNTLVSLLIGSIYHQNHSLLESMLSIIIQRTKLSLFYEYNSFQFRFKMEETEHEMRSEVDNPYCTFRYSNIERYYLIRTIQENISFNQIIP